MKHYSGNETMVLDDWKGLLVTELKAKEEEIARLKDENNKLKGVHPDPCKCPCCGKEDCEWHEGFHTNEAYLESEVARLQADNKSLRDDMADYSFIVEQVAKVYCHITNNQLSKANYEADVVITCSDDVITELVEERVKERITTGVDKTYNSLLVMEEKIRENNLYIERLELEIDKLRTDKRELVEACEEAYRIMFNGIDTKAKRMCKAAVEKHKEGK